MIFTLHICYSDVDILHYPFRRIVIPWQMYFHIRSHYSQLNWVSETQNSVFSSLKSQQKYVYYFQTFSTNRYSPSILQKLRVGSVVSMQRKILSGIPSGFLFCVQMPPRATLYFTLLRSINDILVKHQCRCNQMFWP